MDIEYFDFAEHFDSIACIEQLPKSYVNQKIDLRYQSVTITKENEASRIYIGPKADDQGGDALIIWLDSSEKLIEYQVERIAPPPLF